MARNWRFIRWVVAFAAAAGLSLGHRRVGSYNHFPVTRSRAYGTGRSKRDGTPGHPYMPFPKSLKDIYEVKVHLRSGSFGDVWLVEDENGVDKVLKVLYYKADDNIQYATWAKAHEEEQLGYPSFLEDLRATSLECSIAESMRLSPFSDGAEGSKHIMACYKNFLTVEDPNNNRMIESTSSVLYLELQNCGNTDLQAFMEMHIKMRLWTPRLIMRVYSQLLEALSYLSQHPHRWVHHDLKPENIVIKTHSRSGDGLVQSDADTFTLYLVDFGATMQGTPWHMCVEGSVSTGRYAPYEWGRSCRGTDGFKSSKAFQTCREAVTGNVSVNQDPCPQAFDVFASFMVLITMLSGDRLEYVFPGYWNGANDEWKFRKLDKLADNPMLLFNLVDQSRSKRARKRHDLSPYFNVIEAAGTGLHKHAKRRLSARDILSVMRMSGVL